jgi:hypothetical protein
MHVESLRGVPIASFLIFLPALAAMPKKSACSIKATNTLPKIAGMKIGQNDRSTRTPELAKP